MKNLTRLALAALLFTASASHAQPVRKQFKDWLVACDNTRTCSATGVCAPGPAQ